MSGFITSLSELAALIFNSFRLSILLPSIVFTLANVAIVLPALKNSLLGKIYYTQDQTGQAALVVIFIAFMTYFLSTINFSLIRFFEGYSLQQWPWLRIWPGTWLQDIHRRRYLELWRRWNVLTEHNSPKSTAFLLAGNLPSSEEQRQIIGYQEIMTELTLYYPEKPSRFLPTTFGNIIAAAEDYPYTLYGIDAVAMWPLFIPILTQVGYAKFIEQEKAAVDFLINSLILSAVLGLEIIFVSWFHGVHLYILLLQLFAVLMTIIMLYHLSIDGAMSWAFTIRTSFDLYRDHLRRALRIKPAIDFATERNYWELASQFYKERSSDLGSEVFDYRQEVMSAKPENVTK